MRLLITLSIWSAITDHSPPAVAAQRPHPYACHPFMRDPEIRDWAYAKLDGDEICYFLFHFNKTQPKKTGNKQDIEVQIKFLDAIEACRLKSESLLPSVHSREEEEFLVGFALHNGVCFETNVKDNCHGRRAASRSTEILDVIPMGARIYEKESNNFYIEEWNDGLKPTYRADRDLPLGSYPVGESQVYGTEVYPIIHIRQLLFSEKPWEIRKIADDWRNIPVFCKYNRSRFHPKTSKPTEVALPDRSTRASVPLAQTESGNRTQKQNRAHTFGGGRSEVIMLVIFKLIVGACV